ncbi:MAG: hypothetical protein EPN93_15720 [Spirochaetes bacterium]|nr:MAG: hypothetical protein EPN93_15720 [Spirochaetota bacterium]
MNFGFILILLALMMSAVSLFFYLRSPGDTRMRAAARRTWYLAGGAMGAAMLLLLAYFLLHRFEFAYVHDYSSRDLHPAYLVAALWAGQEGSILLWTLMVSACGVFVIAKNENDERLIMAVLLSVKIALLVLLTVHSPFRYVWEDGSGQFAIGVVPPDGAGLNALLKDPWMVVHPPALFAGYATAAVPFAYAIAALAGRDFSGWAIRARGWVLVSAATLGIGIFLGGYWAYKVLGWGGYWGWDPVENSSLIPWLVILALLHGLILQRRKGGLVRTNLGLALASFVLVVYATFLTRSGVLSDFSVHSFGDLGLSKYLLVILFIFAGGSLFLYAVRLPAMKGAPLSAQALSWDTLMSFGLVTLLFYALLILAGTSMPILSSLFSEKPFSVQQGFYTQVSVPMGILILAFMGLAPVSMFMGRTRPWTLAAAGAAAVGAAVLFNIFLTTEPVPYIFTALAFFCAILAAKDLATLNAKALLASRIAHLGVAVIVAGFITSSFHSVSEKKELVQGKAENVLGESITFKEFRAGEKPALIFTRETPGGPQELATPYFNDTHGKLVKEPAIRYGFVHDLYVAPIEFRSGPDEGAHVQLAMNAPAEHAGMTMTLEKFDRNRELMITGRGRILARIRVERNGAAELIAPGIGISGGEKEAIIAVLGSTGQRVFLEEVNASTQRAVIFIEPVAGAPVPPDSALVEVSKKRMIWLVWLGTVLITAGCFFALRRAPASS